MCIKSKKRYFHICHPKENEEIVMEKNIRLENNVIIYEAKTKLLNRSSCKIEKNLIDNKDLKKVRFSRFEKIAYTYSSLSYDRTPIKPIITLQTIVNCLCLK